ncbi:MAG: rod-binding protein [Myxococcota bacterium]
MSDLAGIQAMQPPPAAPAAGATPAQAAERFEAYILKMILSEMRKTIGAGDSSLLSSRATRSYDVLMDDALSRQMAEKGTFGLAQQILKQLEPGS